MCYSEFNDIIASIADMDADVITIETSRSDMELLDAFDSFKYPNEIGPGVYDIHSPNIPTQESHRAADAQGRRAYSRRRLVDQARRDGVYVPQFGRTATPSRPEREEKSPGDRAIEHRLRSIIRWNAMAIILRANKESSELGGHIASFQSRPRRSTTSASATSGTRRPTRMAAT